MDEVVQQLESAAISGNEENTNNFENLYKNNGKVTGSQEERRKNILEKQKCNRNSKLDKFRGILELVNAVEEDIFATPRTHWKPTIYVSGFNKIANYCDVLMMSEWMFEKPSDFAENWLVVPCPKGVRMLVIAHKGTTKFFNKFGNFRFECRTSLPGGNPCQIKSNQNIVVLDGFFHKDSNVLYVLDILAWNSCVMTEGEASFRHFWMSGHLEQIPELQLITKKNKVIFKVIPKLPCDDDSLNEFLSTFPYYNHNMPPVDGLLFYHKKAQYFAGETPLVGWLYPFMLPEVLGEQIKVHKGYLLEKPVDYTNFMDFIEEFENRNLRKRQKKIFGPKKMEVGTFVPEEQVKTETAGASANGNETDQEQKEKEETTEEKTMDTDGNDLPQVEVPATELSNGNAEASKQPKNGDAESDLKINVENKMDAETIEENNLEEVKAK